MLFDPKDLHPGYTVEEIEKLFFLRKDLSDLSEQDKDALLAKVNSLGLKDIRIDTAYILLCVMHEARAINQPRFLKEVFLPWQELRQKTRPHSERIGEELSRIGEFELGSVEEAAHAANVYRNIVSDLFDPYLTLVVACFQFKDGKFSNLEDADLVFFFSQVGKLTAIDPAVVKPNRWAELTPPQIQHDLLSMIGVSKPHPRQQIHKGHVSQRGHKPSPR